jgi:hypothetical protein
MGPKVCGVDLPRGTFERSEVPKVVNYCALVVGAVGAAAVLVAAAHEGDLAVLLTEVGTQEYRSGKASTSMP